MTVEDLLVAKSITWLNPGCGVALNSDRGTLYISEADANQLVEQWNGQSHLIHHFTDMKTRKQQQIWIPAEMMRMLKIGYSITQISSGDRL